MKNFFRTTPFVLAFFLITLSANFVPYLFLFSWIQTFVITVFLILIVFIINGKKIVQVKNGLSVFFYLLFIFYLFLSLFWTPTFDLALTKLLKLSLLSLSCLLVASINFTKKDYFHGFILYIVFLLFAMIFQGDFISLFNSMVSGVRFEIESASSVNLGYFYGLLSLILLISYINGANYLIYLSLIFALFCIFTGSRGPLISLIISSVYYLYLNSRTGFRTGNGTILAVLTGSIFIGTLFVFVDGFSSLINSRISSVGAILSAQQRLIHINESFQMISQFNIIELLFGTGLSSYGYNIVGYEVRAYPHNLILEVLIECGIIGLIFITSFLITSIHNLIRSKNENFTSACIALFLYCFIRSFSSGSIDENFILFGVLFLCNYPNKFFEKG